MDETNTAIAAIELRSDLFSHGRHAEDGEQVIDEAFTVEVTFQNGRRFLHKATYRVGHDCRAHGCYWANEEEDAEPCKARAANTFDHTNDAREAGEKLLARVQAAHEAKRWAGPVGNENWTETDPAYGSEAWEAYGQGAIEAERERREAGLPF